MPGIKPKEIEVSVEDNVLTIRAESTQETESEQAGYLVRERSYGSFYRAVRLPGSGDTEKIHPVYEHGVLTITLPKTEEKKRKQIKVIIRGVVKAIESSDRKKP